LNPSGKALKISSERSFEVRFNKALRCMELCILDGDGMYPLVLRDPSATKLYCIEKTRGGGLKMSAI
jgi:hypothetical protein